MKGNQLILVAFYLLKTILWIYSENTFLEVMRSNLLIYALRSKLNGLKSTQTKEIKSK